MKEVSKGAATAEAVGRVVGGMASAGRWFDPEYAPQCGHAGCTKPATETESFRLRTPSGSRYKTKLTHFHRCDEHEHSHWTDIGFDG